MSYNNNNEDRRPEIVEDAPAFHSVAMMSAPAAVPLRSAETESLSKQSFGVYEHPALRSIPVKNKAVVPQLSVGAALVATTTPWKVSKPLAIPSYHMLERTHTNVSGASPEEVSERIANFLRTESIAATFDNQQCIARAETQHCLKFAVRLWNNTDGQIVVEVQRTAGCCFLFQETAKAVLRAAKNGTVGDSNRTPALGPRRSLPMPKCVPLIPDSVWEECTQDDLNNACALFQPGNRLDAHMLAAESLVQLSEASKCRLFCAQKILTPQSEILPALVSLVQCSRMNNKEGDITDKGNDEGSTMEEAHFQLMHRHALTVLANCLGVLQETGELCSCLADLPELTSEMTVQALVDDLGTASTLPHTAAAACRCLHALCGGSGECQKALVRLGGKPLALAALQECRHKLLESEASKLMQDL